MSVAAKKEKRHLLSHEETLELIEKAQNGDEEAKEVLISNNLGWKNSRMGNGQPRK